jgi:hypothetical protein
MRKHMISINDIEEVQFYAWECISLELEGR